MRPAPQLASPARRSPRAGICPRTARRLISASTPSGEGAKRSGPLDPSSRGVSVGSTRKGMCRLAARPTIAPSDRSLSEVRGVFRTKGTPRLCRASTAAHRRSNEPGSRVTASWEPASAPCRLISTDNGRSCARASAASSPRELPLVITRTAKARCRASRAISKKSGCSKGSPPLNVTVRVPSDRRSSSTSSHAAQLQGLRIGAFAAVAAEHAAATTRVGELQVRRERARPGQGATLEGVKPEGSSPAHGATRSSPSASADCSRFQGGSDGDHSMR